ncbi:MAG: helix-turn-helix transcriptional regulator [Methanoregula sp.]|jgi:putative transcriptional regulator
MKNKIKVYRAMRNMTQEELAGQLRVTRRTINSIEGDKYNPSIDLAFRMAKLFGVPVEELFLLDEDPGQG